MTGYAFCTAHRFVAVALWTVLLPALATRVASQETGWISLFDGKTLEGWKVTDFGGDANEVRIEEGKLILDMGAAGMSGVTRTAPVPRVNYEVTLDAMRVSGSDFFCGFTFPIGDACCSLIVGGWGGTLIGISSFDGMDASQNETTTFKEFESGIWYPIRVRVTRDRIRAWVNGDDVVDVRTGDRKVSVRMEVEPSQPFGFATWHTKAALRNIRLRHLAPKEIQAEEE